MRRLQRSLYIFTYMCTESLMNSLHQMSSFFFHPDRFEGSRAWRSNIPRVKTSNETQLAHAAKEEVRKETTLLRSTQPNGTQILLVICLKNVRDISLFTLFLILLFSE